MGRVLDGSMVLRMFLSGKWGFVFLGVMFCRNRFLYAFTYLVVGGSNSGLEGYGFCVKRERVGAVVV